MSVTFKEMLVRLGAYKVVGPVVDLAYVNVIAREWYHQLNDAPHGRPWHVSFHASSFPGDTEQACGRYAMYGLMDVPKGEAPDPWLDEVANIGKAIELNVVRKVRDDGRLILSGQPGRSTDPDARDENGKPMPQIGFEDAEHWLTGSVDLPLLPVNYSTPHIVEVKTKHEGKIDEMMLGMRGPDETHRRQLLCSLGLAHENPDAFLHPQTGEPMPPAVDGSIFYRARDTEWPGPMKKHEFFFSYSAAYMEQGRAHLRDWRQNFIEGELPQPIPRKNARSHPYGWKWSEGICKYCPLKKACKKDYEEGITKIADSHAVAVAQFTRPGYNAAAKRAAVFETWGLDDPLAPS